MIVDEESYAALNTLRDRMMIHIKVPMAGRVSDLVDPYTKVTARTTFEAQMGRIDYVAWLFARLRINR